MHSNPRFSSAILKPPIPENTSRNFIFFVLSRLFFKSISPPLQFAQENSLLNRLFKLRTFQVFICQKFFCFLKIFAGLKKRNQRIKHFLSLNAEFCFRKEFKQFINLNLPLYFFFFLEL